MAAPGKSAEGFWTGTGSKVIVAQLAFESGHPRSPNIAAGEGEVSAGADDLAFGAVVNRSDFLGRWYQSQSFCYIQVILLLLVQAKSRSHHCWSHPG